MKSFFCLFRLLLHTLGAFFYGTVVYPFIDDSKKNLYVQKWSKKLLDICGVTVKVVNPELLSPRALIVANHVSWLDIFLIYSVVPAISSPRPTWPAGRWSLAVPQDRHAFSGTQQRQKPQKHPGDTGQKPESPGTLHLFPGRNDRQTGKNAAVSSQSFRGSDQRRLAGSAFRC